MSGAISAPASKTSYALNINSLFTRYYLPTTLTRSLDFAAVYWTELDWTGLKTDRLTNLVTNSLSHSFKLHYTELRTGAPART
jgi:hypothetical protein